MSCGTILIGMRSIATSGKWWNAACARPEEWREGQAATLRPRQELTDADHVVRRRGERHDPIHQLAAAMPQFPQAADRFHPAKDLLDQFSLALADCLTVGG